MTWDGHDRRSGKGSRRVGDECPMKGDCPAVLHRLQADMEGAIKRLDTVNGTVKKVEEEISPVRDLRLLSNNKLVAALLVGLLLSIGGWVYTHIAGLPTNVEMRMLEQHRVDGDAAARDYMAFKAVTTEKVRSIETTLQEVKKTTEETNVLLHNLSARLATTNK
jgi:hypothetical protein